MSGYTGFSVGILRYTVGYIPVQTINDWGSRRVSLESRVWLRLMSMIQQRPMLNSEEAKEKAEERVIKEKQELNERINRIKKRVRIQHEKSSVFFGSFHNQPSED